MHPGAGHALDVQHLEGVRNYQTLDLVVVVNLPVLHALNCGGYSAENLSSPLTSDKVIVQQQEGRIGRL